MFVLQKLSPTLSSPLYEEDLGDQIYYSEDDDDDDILLDDAVAHAATHVENSSGRNNPSEVHQDRASLLLSQLTSGSLPSQATIDMAIEQLMEALTAEEKQLMAQMVQQMAVTNPILFGSNPMALQVEAIRMILTTRSQRAVALGMPTVQQVAYQAQLPQNHLPVVTAAASVVAAAESCPVSVHHNIQSEDLPVLTRASRARQHRVMDESADKFPVPKSRDSTALGTDIRYPDECSSASSGHVQLGAGLALARGRGRGLLSTDRQYDNAACQQDQRRGRGLRRCTSRNSAAADARSVPIPVCHPLIPPVSHTAQNEPEGNFDVNNPENWEEEIDEFGSGVFHVKSSFFRSGTR